MNSETTQPGVLEELSSGLGSHVVVRTDAHGNPITSAVDTSAVQGDSTNTVNTIVAEGTKDGVTTALKSNENAALTEIGRIGAKYHAIIAHMGDEFDDLKAAFESHLEDVVAKFRARAERNEDEAAIKKGSEDADKPVPTKADPNGAVAEQVAAASSGAQATGAATAPTSTTGADITQDDPNAAPTSTGADMTGTGDGDGAGDGSDAGAPGATGQGDLGASAQGTTGTGSFDQSQGTGSFDTGKSSS